SYLTGGLKEANPYSYVLSGVDDEKEDKQNVQLVQDALEKHNVQTDKEIVNYWTIPYEGDIQTEIVKVSEYNQLAQLLGKEELDLKKMRLSLQKKDQLICMKVIEMKSY